MINLNATHREMDLLVIPSNCGSLRLVQWPLFLLTSKVYSDKHWKQLYLIRMRISSGYMDVDFVADS